MASLSSLLLGSSFLLVAAVFLHHHIGASTTTHLHFYMHDAYTGPTPTAMRVVSGRSLLDGGGGGGGDLASSPRQFGDIVALNNVLTEGPSAGSARVGTAQGFAVRVSEGGVVSDLSLHMVLEGGEHGGSSVTAKGRIDMDVRERESVVIGGTGRFRFARGYMVTKNYDYSLANGGAVEIDVYLQY
ncbi:dirigent protein 1-like [Oryza brachyantha]|uniref:dirigent protein 1-like n=1 Tax=Oryza brachyantha TaxID=4533 RepID=UPI001ADA7ACA|nr:dirigent protein 1-like [Oryza brachyantha]